MTIDEALKNYSLKCSEIGENSIKQGLALALISKPQVRDLAIQPHQVSKNLEKQAESLLGKELTIEEFKEQILILKDLFTKADLPNTFALLLESWEELVKINHIFENLGQRFPHFSDNDESSSSEDEGGGENDDDSDEETNNSESGSENGDDSDNDSDSEDIDINFTEELVKEWVNNGFNYDTAKE
ncbi:1481_t:CDS:2 [Entrophospora sp. SA101]|nr:11503_t:CDS:2 [Entrophospora sp. SA101]CAJ0747192.1 1481_t:CDS:2 [Entrophospora sp. SA101]CAJ0899618.1 13324_t:CDS:2 [Entrophospora sp. SA101]